MAMILRCSTKLCWLDLAMAFAILATGMLSQLYVPSAEAQCVPGDCGVGVSVGLRGPLGNRLSVGAGIGIRRPAVSSDSCVLPVCFSTDPIPAAGIYIGTIGKYGVTLTCQHAARYGVANVAGEKPSGVTSDKYGYDMAAVLTQPMDATPATLGPSPRTGDPVTIIGYPGGQYRSHRGRVRGYAAPTGGQQWGDLLIDVGSRDGDSGGAVLNGDGQLVGLLWGTSADGEPGSVATSAPAIAEFLDRLRITFGAADELPPTPVPELPLPEAVQPSTDCSKLFVLIEQNSQAIALLISRAGEPGPKGDKGDTGLPGEPGPKGDSIGFASLSEWDILALAKRLPPVRIQTVTTDGDVIQEATHYLGGPPLRLRLVPVQSGDK